MDRILDIRFSEIAKKDLAFFKQIGKKKIVEKIKSLLLSIQQDPYSGIGKPEALKYDFAGCWSRRIDKEHRLIYEVKEKEKLIVILSLKGHYDYD